VGTEKEWQRDGLSAFVLETVRRWAPETKFIFLKNRAKIPSYAFALMMRSLLAIRFTEDFSIISDVDMLPLKRSYFSVGDKSQLHYFDPGVLGKPPYKIATCYVGALGHLWQKLLKVTEAEVTPAYLESIYEKYNRQIQNGKRPERKKYVFWDIDQLYITDALLRSEEFQNNLHKPSQRRTGSDPHIPGDRIDRADWKFDPKIAQDYIDAHMVRREPWDKAHKDWKIFRNILATYVPDRSAAVVEYTNRFAFLWGRKRQKILGLLERGLRFMRHRILRETPLSASFR
jgi:hypothetical protein